MAQLPPKIPPPTLLHSHNPHPSWADEFLGFTSVRRGTHRRSMSDSITFVEAAAAITAMPALVELEISQRNDDNVDGNANFLSENNLGFDKLDDDQLMSMFSDDMSFPTSSSSPSTPSSDQNNHDYQAKGITSVPPIVGGGEGHFLHQPVEVSHYKSGEAGEAAESSCEQEEAPQPPGLSFADRDPMVNDPKRVKRILANRQSAQRSRVRKLQYISELERSVTALQAEVSVLSPRVAFLDHHRLLLTLDNSALKQRIAALGQDKIFKHAHQDALKTEIERLRHLYEQQQHQPKHTKADKEPTPLPLINS